MIQFQGGCFGQPRQSSIFKGCSIYPFLQLIYLRWYLALARDGAMTTVSIPSTYWRLCQEGCQLGWSMLVHEPATRPGTVMSVGQCQSLGAFLIRRRRLSSKGECSFGLGDQSRLWGFPGPHVPGSLNLRVISFYLTMLGLILWTQTYALLYLGVDLTCLVFYYNMCSILYQLGYLSLLALIL